MSMGGPSSETGPSTDRSRLASFTADHPGEVLLVVGAVAYALGYVNLRLVAAGLGVAPSDLGLNTNDYLMSAATWILLLSPFMVGYVLVQRLVRAVGWRSATGVSLFAGTAGAALLAVLLTAQAVSVGAAVRGNRRHPACRRSRLVAGRAGRDRDDHCCSCRPDRDAAISSSMGRGPERGSRQIGCSGLARIGSLGGGGHGGPDDRRGMRRSAVLRRVCDRRFGPGRTTASRSGPATASTTHRCRMTRRSSLSISPSEVAWPTDRLRTR